MATKLLAFLGLGKDGGYQEVAYALADKSYVSRYAALATAKLINEKYGADTHVEQAFALVTDEAKAKTYPGFEDAWKMALPDIPLVPVSISSTQSLDGQWEIFRTLSGLISAGDRLIFDITHAFRSMPLVALLVIAFVKAVHPDVKLEMLSYAELRNDGPSPIHDLTPLASLLDWTSAVQDFSRSGNAGPLSGLLRGIAASCHRDGSILAAEKPQVLSTFAQRFVEFTASLQTFRYDQAIECSTTLKGALDSIYPGSPDAKAAPPLEFLKEQILQTIMPFSTCQANSPIADLELQRNLLTWFLEREQYFPFIALLRELMSGYVARDLGYYADSALDEKRLRLLHDYVDTFLMGYSSYQKDPESFRPWKARNPEDPFQVELEERSIEDTFTQIQLLPYFTELQSLADGVAKVRNAMMHAGMSYDEMKNSGVQVQGLLQEYYRQFEALYEKHLTPSARIAI